MTIDYEVLDFVQNREQRWGDQLVRLRQRVKDPGVIVEGKLSRAAGLTLEAIGGEAALGTRCLIEGNDGEQVEAEVVGFADNRLFLMPTSNLIGVMPRARVIPTRNVSRAPNLHKSTGFN